MPNFIALESVSSSTKGAGGAYALHEDDFDPEEQFIFWVFDKWADTVHDLVEQASIVNVSMILQLPGALYKLSPLDREAAYIIDAFEFARSDEFWNSLDESDRNYTGTMCSRLEPIITRIRSN